ncbi:50S ribosomal protein L9 [Trichlorobacter lovleyi]|uniref:Large ribosomal subunit protein bL9 n=1 Tax=Trichlorobacter lovleyi (strain ATCC BAA-1151 / DSM 17278 / SZ) TaxID=398767 RepID=RL9_TRIL1|nr:50S ribosomal protein L9 [Trichlorobacter lovleyi]B3E6H6.1 RecName: Full=Large ribosomal subunit protein bL9; AltName: Full=50S ribosomal protein L9 [Trichlorobacter lovleyi SZ]ACD96323.1 ribosomal protein L9 [Trichlorobacter lovleyi SZ]
MKLILKENIEHLGQIGDIVKVAPGYARNYLLPKGLAIEATEKNAKALEHAKRQLAYKKNKSLEAAKNLVAKLEALSIVLTHQAGEEGKLFGSVTNMEIAAFLKDNGLEIDRKKIVLAEPIKQLGEYSVPVKVHPEVGATLKVTVSAA